MRIGEIKGTVTARLARVVDLAPKGARRHADSLLVTLTGQALTLAGLFLITRVSVQAFGAIGFGEYQVARRTLAVVAFPLMCGLGVSVLRFIACDISRREEVGTWMLSAFCLTAILISAFLTLGWLFSPAIGRWTFGTDSGQYLVLALLLAVAGPRTQRYSDGEGLAAEDRRNR
jgi:O-antigen/teichoic acid export membrane protein